MSFDRPCLFPTSWVPSRIALSLSNSLKQNRAPHYVLYNFLYCYQFRLHATTRDLFLLQRFLQYGRTSLKIWKHIYVPYPSRLHYQWTPDNTSHIATTTTTTTTTTTVISNTTTTQLLQLLPLSLRTAAPIITTVTTTTTTVIITTTTTTSGILYSAQLCSTVLYYTLFHLPG